MKREKTTVRCHQKKLDNLLKEKNENNNIFEIWNTFVTNMSSHVLTNEEYQVLKFGLKYGRATRSNERSVLAYVENILGQVERLNICCNLIYPKARFKNSLHGPLFNIINIDDTRMFKDIKEIKLIQESCKTFILKRNKGYGDALIIIKMII